MRRGSDRRRFATAYLLSMCIHVLALALAVLLVRHALESGAEPEAALPPDTTIAVTMPSSPPTVAPTSRPRRTVVRPPVPVAAHRPAVAVRPPAARRPAPKHPPVAPHELAHIVPHASPQPPAPVPTGPPATAPPLQIAGLPSAAPTRAPTTPPTEQPTALPTPEPTLRPTPVPTEEATLRPTPEPTDEPAARSTPEPTARPTPEPTVRPTDVPTAVSTVRPIAVATARPTAVPTARPTAAATAAATARASAVPLAPARVAAAPARATPGPGALAGPGAHPGSSADTAGGTTHGTGSGGGAPASGGGASGSGASAGTTPRPAGGAGGGVALAPAASPGPGLGSLNDRLKAALPTAPVATMKRYDLSGSSQSVLDAYEQQLAPPLEILLKTFGLIYTKRTATQADSIAYVYERTRILGVDVCRAYTIVEHPLRSVAPNSDHIGPLAAPPLPGPLRDVKPEISTQVVSCSAKGMIPVTPGSLTSPAPRHPDLATPSPAPS